MDAVFGYLLSGRCSAYSPLVLAPLEQFKGQDSDVFDDSQHPKMTSKWSYQQGMSYFANLIMSMTFVGPLLDQCCPSTLFTLRAVCSDLRRRVDWYCLIAFNINNLLESTFFSDARRFRQMQDETQAVISGSFALQFFSRSAFSAFDLDLYVDYKHALKVCQFFYEESQYDYHPRPGQPIDYKSALDKDYLDCNDYGRVAGILTVLRFEGEHRGVKRRIDLVVVVEEGSIMETLLRFHSSAYIVSANFDATVYFFGSGGLERYNVSTSVLFLPPWNVQPATIARSGLKT